MQQQVCMNGQMTPVSQYQPSQQVIQQQQQYYQPVSQMQMRHQAAAQQQHFVFPAGTPQPIYYGNQGEWMVASPQMQAAVFDYGTPQQYTTPLPQECANYYRQFDMNYEV